MRISDWCSDVCFSDLPAALGLEARPLGLGEGEGGAVVDRRPSGGQRHLALQTQLLRRLVAGIETSRRLQARGGGGVAVEPLGLHRLLVPLAAEPAQVVLDRLGDFRRREPGAGFVEVQPLALAVGCGYTTV